MLLSPLRLTGRSPTFLTLRGLNNWWRCCSIGIVTTVALRGISCGTNLPRVSSFLSQPTCAFVTATAPSRSPGSCMAVSSASMNEKSLRSPDLTMPHPIGLGTYMMPGEQVASTLRYAILQAGYRRIDCAPVYFNEDAIGDSLAELLVQSSVQRSDLYIVSKLPSPFHRQVEQAVRKTLNDLRLDYLDLYLVHWPVAFFPVPIDPAQRGWDNEDIDDSKNGKNIDESVSIHEVWQGMERVVQLGLVRRIGVSNMPVMLLHELLTRAKIPPAVNQVELHPYLQQERLLKYCQRRNIHVQAYSPLGSPGYKGDDEPNVLDDPLLRQIAAAHAITPAQLCIVWAVQRGTSVVVKSVQESRLKENLQMSNGTVRLTREEMSQIASLDRGYRFFRPQDWWGDKGMAVFD